MIQSESQTNELRYFDASQPEKILDTTCTTKPVVDFVWAIAIARGPSGYKGDKTNRAEAGVAGRLLPRSAGALEGFPYCRP